jgi:hypothetical protein
MESVKIPITESIRNLSRERNVFKTESKVDPEFRDITEYLTSHTYPQSLSREEKVVFQYKVAYYTLIMGVLFKSGPDEQLRRCLEPGERKPIIKSLHKDPVGGHFTVQSTVGRIRAAGYWWPYLRRDVKLFIQSCDPCQRTGNPKTRNHWLLTPIILIAPFEKWRVDFIDPILPISRKKQRYIILATDYATRWVEARASIRNDAHTSASFLFERIIIRFGCPLELISDRGTHFLNEVISNLTTRYDIKHRKTTPYNPKANGLTERVNKIVGNILTKVVSAHKTDWDEKLYSAVYAYNTSHKITTGRSPYFLVFGQDVLQNIETKIETLRVIVFRNGEGVESLDNRLEEIEALEEARGEALQRTQKVQEKRKAAFDKKIPAENRITKDKIVLLYDSRYRNFPSKLHTRWMGPFVVDKVFDNGSLQLKDLQENLLETKTNGSRVKLYRPLESATLD